MSQLLEPHPLIPSTPKMSPAANIAFVLATLGLASTALLAVSTLLPVVGIAVGAVPPDAALVLAVAAPLFMLLGALAFVLSMAALIVAGVSHCRVATLMAIWALVTGAATGIILMVAGMPLALVPAAPMLL